jgi:hypothetical protein
MNKSKATKLAKQLQDKGASGYIGKPGAEQILGETLTDTGWRKVRTAFYELLIETKRRPVIEQMYVEERLHARTNS